MGDARCGGTDQAECWDGCDAVSKIYARLWHHSMVPLWTWRKHSTESQRDVAL